ncbi:hypothetical protein F5050DRAFT_207151 [Lentinula boryana]|uniref:JmjC domain-containing protein n=1 Tax=Lentinula boryana TaxID=40481 RepID=A0ABQ8QBM8_9AGAR|nr:hypothetical protein F5050DRAFT_207151 [Lentinula boryana]
MSYIGTGDTFTPSHKDLCASHGHNLMCYTENEGSSFWFMTRRQDARAVADYFHNKLEHDIDHESYVTSVEDFARAPFPVYVIEQKLGDLVIVPRTSCHQVVNHGGVTVKVSWSRMSLKSISQAVYYELPLCRRVCRPEIYRVRLTLYHTIRALYTKFSEQMRQHTVLSCSTDLRNQAQQITQALRIFDDVLQNESVEDYVALPCYSSSESNLSCDFCGADIFQSFLECEECSSDADPCTICPDCYAEGRSCSCQLMQPTQVRPLDNILQERGEVIRGLQEHWKTSSEEGVEFATKAALMKGGAFKAACVLARTRQQKTKISTCSKVQSHQLQHSDVIQCKLCHNGSCFFHLLKKSKLHSIYVLLDRNKDAELNNHRNHHERHKQGPKNYTSHLREYLNDERSTVRPKKFEIQMVDLASSFPKCRPINYLRTRAGWYDSIIVPVVMRVSVYWYQVIKY